LPRASIRLIKTAKKNKIFSKKPESIGFFDDPAVTMAAMNEESILAQIVVRFGTTEDLERDNPELMDGEFCVEVLSGGGWYVKRGKLADGELLRWQELPYFDLDNVHGLRGKINEIMAAIAQEAQAREEADNAEAQTREEADVALAEADSQEAQAREEADNAEAQERAAKDTAEACARKKADSQLRAGIKAETRARKRADAAAARIRSAKDAQLQTAISIEACIRAVKDIQLRANIKAETCARKTADEEHAALTIAHGATAYPSPNRIPLYNQYKKLHTGGPAAAYWDAVRFHEFKALLEKVSDLEMAADDVLVTEEGDFVTTESGVLLNL
jgi:hypothetical protein